MLKRATFHCRLAAAQQQLEAGPQQPQPPQPAAWSPAAAQTGRTSPAAPMSQPWFAAASMAGYPGAGMPMMSAFDPMAAWYVQHGPGSMAAAGWAAPGGFPMLPMLSPSGGGSPAMQQQGMQQPGAVQGAMQSMQQPGAMQPGAMQPAAMQQGTMQFGSLGAAAGLAAQPMGASSMGWYGAAAQPWGPPMGSSPAVHPGLVLQAASVWFQPMPTPPFTAAAPGGGMHAGGSGYRVAPAAFGGPGMGSLGSGMLPGFPQVIAGMPYPAMVEGGFGGGQGYGMPAAEAAMPSGPASQPPWAQPQLPLQRQPHSQPQPQPQPQPGGNGLIAAQGPQDAGHQPPVQWEESKRQHKRQKREGESSPRTPEQHA